MKYMPNQQHNIFVGGCDLLPYTAVNMIIVNCDNEGGRFVAAPASFSSRLIIIVLNSILHRITDRERMNGNFKIRISCLIQCSFMKHREENAWWALYAGKFPIVHYLHLHNIHLGRKLSSRIHYKVWAGIVYSFPNINGAAVEVRELKSTFTPHFTEHVITYPCWN